MDDELLIIVILFILFLLITLAIYSYYRNKKWVEALAQYAQEKGYRFSRQRDDSLRDTFQALGLELFQRGHTRRLTNHISGSHRQTSFDLFDYRYTTGSGKYSHTHLQTVIAFDAIGENNPAFILRPQGLFDKLAEKFGKKDIDFELYPEFSKKYHLTGNDENAIRSVFNSSLIDFFQNVTDIKERCGWIVESDGKRLVIYRSGKRCNNIEVLQAFSTQAQQFMDMISRPRFNL